MCLNYYRNWWKLRHDNVLLTVTDWAAFRRLVASIVPRLPRNLLIILQMCPRLHLTSSRRVIASLICPRDYYWEKPEPAIDARDKGSRVIYGSPNNKNQYCVFCMYLSCKGMFLSCRITTIYILSWSFHFVMSLYLLLLILKHNITFEFVIEDSERYM